MSGSPAKRFLQAANDGGRSPKLSSPTALKTHIKTRQKKHEQGSALQQQQSAVVNDARVRRKRAGKRSHLSRKHAGTSALETDSIFHEENIVKTANTGGVDVSERVAFYESLGGRIITKGKRKRSSAAAAEANGATMTALQTAHEFPLTDNDAAGFRDVDFKTTPVSSPLQLESRSSPAVARAEVSLCDLFTGVKESPPKRQRVHYSAHHEDDPHPIRSSATWFDALRDKDERIRMLVAELHAEMDEDEQFQRTVANFIQQLQAKIMLLEQQVTSREAELHSVVELQRCRRSQEDHSSHELHDLRQFREFAEEAFIAQRQAHGADRASLQADIERAEAMQHAATDRLELVQQEMLELSLKSLQEKYELEERLREADGVVLACKKIAMTEQELSRKLEAQILASSRRKQGNQTSPEYQDLEKRLLEAEQLALGWKRAALQERKRTVKLQAQLLTLSHQDGNQTTSSARSTY